VNVNKSLACCPERVNLDSLNTLWKCVDKVGGIEGERWKIARECISESKERFSVVSAID
jgi:hypothetical protein